MHVQGSFERKRFKITNLKFDNRTRVVWKSRYNVFKLIQKVHIMEHFKYTGSSQFIYFFHFLPY